MFHLLVQWRYVSSWCLMTVVTWLPYTLFIVWLHLFHHVWTVWKPDTCYSTRSNISSARAGIQPTLYVMALLWHWDMVTLLLIQFLRYVSIVLSFVIIIITTFTVYHSISLPLQRKLTFSINPFHHSLSLTFSDRSHGFLWPFPDLISSSFFF